MRPLFLDSEKLIPFKNLTYFPSVPVNGQRVIFQYTWPCDKIIYNRVILILKEISPENSLEGLMLKLKHQYFSHLMQKAGSLEKTLTLRKIEGRKKEKGKTEDWDGWMASPTQMDMSLSRLQELVVDREAWRAAAMALQRVRHDSATELTKIRLSSNVWLTKISLQFSPIYGITFILILFP